MSYNNSAATTTPDIPPRPTVSGGVVVDGPVVTSDIVTTNQSAPIHSTTSFTTNQGADAHVKSLPVTAQEAPLVQPSRGLMHSIKKAFTTGSNVEQDPVVAHAQETLRANHNHTKELDNRLRAYQAAQRALQEATVAVSTAFNKVLSDERNPYNSLSGEVLRSTQLHPVVPSQGHHVTDLTGTGVSDMDDGMAQIDRELRDRKTKQSDVEYYLAKVDKLSTTQESHLQNNPNKVSAADSEKLERNIGKAKEVQLEYNQENEQLIDNMNALWRRRIVRLGPALAGFIAQNQLVYQEQAAMWQRLLQASTNVNPDIVHNQYLTDSSTMLIPTGAATLNHSAALNSAHAVVGKRAEVEQQQRLIADNQQRVNAVQQTGGRLETVQQDVVVRSEEQMVWSKERFVTERVRLRKVVATEMVTLTVPVRRERIEIDRIPVDGPGVLVSEQETAARMARRNNRRQQRTGAVGPASGTVNPAGTTTTGANTYNNSAATTAGSNNVLSNTAANRDVYDDEYDDEQFELVLCEERPRVVNDIVPVERVRMKKLTQVQTQHLEMDLLKEHIDFQAPNKAAAATNSLVTQTGTLQTIEGRHLQGVVDTTDGQGKIVNLPPMVAGEASVAGTSYSTSDYATRTMTADVDDVAAMQGIGIRQGGQYGNVNTVGYAGQTLQVDRAGLTGANVEAVPVTDSVVGATHPYYNAGATGTTASTATTGTTGYGDSATVATGAPLGYGTPGYVENTTVNSSTTTDEPVNRRNVV